MPSPITFKETHRDELLKIFSLKYSRTIGKLGSGVAAFSVAHNLGFIPAFKVFYQAYDKNSKMWFTFPNTYDGSGAAGTISYYDPFLISFSVSTTAFNFNCVNEDSVDHTLNMVFLIYADRGAI